MKWPLGCKRQMYRAVLQFPFIGKQANANSAKSGRVRSGAGFLTEVRPAR
jgi:hypothetical protein